MANPGDYPGLDDPAQAAHAWARFRTILAWMTLAAATASAATIVALAWVEGPLHLITMLAVLGGVGGSVMMAGALMGLVFLSSGTGHDEAVERFDRED
ncbi:MULTISPECIES: hypothetical protein [unclassified Sphingomonas]|jgi:hypothetical protein|uniref:hypothetical protein n=1 Tax=unclassified Sphingomonas TaxID=196159 RepID=UPI000E108AD8|nr:MULTISPECIES: hypothetical protein [unclassified Sphingomonas]AXJ94961.1 hypothetical protein DM480_05050 [Sphingomonas sp. FARSPH]